MIPIIYTWRNAEDRYPFIKMKVPALPRVGDEVYLGDVESGSKNFVVRRIEFIHEVAEVAINITLGYRYELGSRYEKD